MLMIVYFILCVCVHINVQVDEVKFLIMRFLISLFVSLLLLINGERFTTLPIQKCDQEFDITMTHI